MPSANELPYQFVTASGEPGTGPGQFSDPIGIAVADGEVFVSDSRNGRIQVFGLNGTLKRIVGNAGSGPGEFKAPGGVAVAANGDLFVAGFYNHPIEKSPLRASF